MRQNRTDYPGRKAEMYQQLQEVPKRYSVMALVNMEKVRSSQVLPLRKKLQGDVMFFNIKDRIAKKALNATGIAGIGKIVDRLTGQCMLMLTDMSPFRLNLMLAKNRMMLPARAGDVASIDVVVKEQNTGIAPGPMLTEFKEAKIPTKIDQGTIWIMKDTVPVKKGEAIPEKLAPLLTKLNIKPVEAGISLECALEDGVLYSNEEMTIDMEAVQGEFALCHQEATSLAIEAAYAVPESMGAILAKAAASARSVSVESGFATDETAGAVLQRAHAHGVALADTSKDYAPE
jgi:large subunit ribosomal protein L10